MWPRDENQCHVGIGTFYPLEVFQRHNHLFLLMLKTWSLCSGAEVQSWRPSLGEVEKNSFIALPGTEQHSRLMPQNCVSQPRRIEWVSEQWFKGGVADKIRACIPLIWPHWWASRLSHCDFSLEHLPVVGVFILQNSLKMLLCAPLQGKPGPCPKAALLLLGGSPIVSTSLPSSDEQRFERLPCPGAPQGPGGFHSHNCPEAAGGVSPEFSVTGHPSCVWSLLERRKLKFRKQKKSISWVSQNAHWQDSVLVANLWDGLALVTDSADMIFSSNYPQ